MNHDFSLATRSLSAGDAVILVMGITGVGKSTFISKLTGEDAGIGHDLASYEERLGHRTRESAQEERRRIEEEENDFHESLQQLSLENEEQCVETQQMVEKLRKRDVMKRNLLPLLGVLGGTGLAIAGTVTGLAPLAGAGIGVGFAYASKLEFSRKTEDHTSSKFSLWEGVLGGGQGAAGASLD
ncbi:hypothetical protein FVER53590_09924 [Fusarium verticillioides]|nr:hypothetical protein FVER53590_09924 [Fusarium verticillioides]